MTQALGRERGALYCFKVLLLDGGWEGREGVRDAVGKTPEFFILCYNIPI